MESNKRFSRKASASSTNAAAAPKVSKQRRTTKRLASEEMEELSDNESNLSVGSKAESTRSRASGSISGVDEDTVAGRSRRRAAGAVSYKEPSLNV